MQWRRLLFGDAAEKRKCQDNENKNNIELHIERFQRLKALYNLIKEDWACNAQIIAYKSIADKQQKQNINKHIQHGRTKHGEKHTHTGARVCDVHACSVLFFEAGRKNDCA